MSNSDVCIAPTDARAIADAARARGRAVRRVFVVALVLNAAVAVMMAIYGYVSHSLSVGTDSLHSILDAGANLLALFGLHWSAAPADERHPYGRRKIEILAALGIGVLIVIAMFEFAVAAVHALRGHATPPQIGLGGFVVMIVTMIVNALVARYEHKKAHELGSNLLHADARHTRSDLYASGAVLASFLAVRAGFAWADGAATLVLVALISHVAWEVFSENVPILIDTAVLDPARVIDVARGMAGVRDVHRVRSRGVHHAVELDLHLQVGDEMSLRAAHALARDIETQLRVKFPELSDVVIHIEPGPAAEDPARDPTRGSQPAPQPRNSNPNRSSASHEAFERSPGRSPGLKNLYKALKKLPDRPNARPKDADSGSLTPSATPIRLRIRFCKLLPVPAS